MKKLCMVAVFCLGAIGCCPDVSPMALGMSAGAVIDTRQVAQDYNDLWKPDLQKLLRGDPLSADERNALKCYVDSHGNWMNLNRDRTKNIDRIFQALNQ